MSRPIKFEFLNKPELEYEIRIRLEEPVDTVVRLRKQILRLSSITSSEEILTSPIPIEEELPQVNTTINYLDLKINKLLQGDSKYTRLIETYLNHLFFRFERIDVDVLNSEQKSDLDALRSKFDSLNNKFEPFTFLPAENTPPPPCYLSTSHDNSETPPSIIPPSQTILEALLQQINSTVPPQQVTPHIFKDLKRYAYNGKSCPRSFLQKLKEYCISRSLDEKLLISQAYEIFTDNALHWFRFQINRNPNLTWHETSELLIKDFGVFDYDYKLLEDIRKRTQGLDETISVYISIMSGMFSRLTKKMSESEQLEILLRNIRPCYSVFVALRDCTTIDSLLAVCQNYEKFLDKDKNFKEPSLQQNTLTAEFSYKPRIPVTNSPSVSFQKPPPQYLQKPKQVNTLTRSDPPQQNSFCVRCRVHGHSLNTCKKPHFIICFKCGLKDFKTADCPKCNPKPGTSSKN